MRRETSTHTVEQESPRQGGWVMAEQKHERQLLDVLGDLDVPSPAPDPGDAEAPDGDRVESGRTRPPSSAEHTVDEGTDAALSRRGLLLHLGGAAVAGAGLATGAAMMRPGSAAANLSAMAIGTSNDGGADFTSLFSTTDATTFEAINNHDGGALRGVVIDFGDDPNARGG